MSIDGRVGVDVLVYDKDGTSSIKVISMASHKDTTSGEVVLVTGTASSYTEITYADYRNAAGNLVDLNTVSRIAFKWSGSNCALLRNNGEELFRLYSCNNEAAVTGINDSSITPALDPDGSEVGTYSIVLWGNEAS